MRENIYRRENAVGAAMYELMNKFMTIRREGMGINAIVTHFLMNCADY